jgi:hypothetical protein
MNEALRDELIRMAQEDQAVRADLAREKALFGGYHPRMEAVHRANAERLRAIIAEFGWPGRTLVGEEGASAAWMIAQHAIGEPAFMRQCRGWLDRASAAGDVPRSQFAFIDDRIRTYEGQPQRYGTQLRAGDGGLEPYPLVDVVHVERWRREVGLPPLADILEQVRRSPRVPAATRAAREAEERAWRQRIGWISGSDD